MKSIRKFVQKCDGSLAVEAVLIIPVLIWVIGATIVFWDAFKTISVNEKSTYTVADMLSREAEVDDAYLAKLHEFFDFFAHSSGDNALQITVVTAVDTGSGTAQANLLWSKGVGEMAGRTDLGSLSNRLPNMVAGEHLIVVESLQKWSPAFNVGLANFRFSDTAIIRPRFAPQLKWAEAS